ncbi:predicted protein [Histoplasma capsulatum var. duboisii H88]|uniref:Predicted protein n=2 Tax=Ajellomyces capsulatus TaxID=5037 RepID=F0UUY1_AJEC8|nr:predicted protein [Histoplasma capsulatum H143]EGC49708.1 predicted protein [Histoplasma capsulatum var. duboisii H88]
MPLGKDVQSMQNSKKAFLSIPISKKGALYASRRIWMVKISNNHGKGFGERSRDSLGWSHETPQPLGYQTLNLDKEEAEPVGKQQMHGTGAPESRILPNT